MRILMVSAALDVGGAEEVAVTLAEAAVADGHRVQVASAPGHHLERLRQAGVPHVALRTIGRRPADLLRSVARLRRLETPDLVHAHNPKAALVCRLAFGHRVPILTTLHGVPSSERALAARILARTSDRVVVVSTPLADDLIRRGLSSTRVQVITNGIAPPPPYPRRRARAELGLDESQTVGLCLARLVDQKRHDLLLEAWAAGRQPGTLLIAGEGPNRARIVDGVARRELTHSVRVLGARDDVPRLLAASDVVVLPTDWEGLPLALLEAMAAGVPVVASRVRGVTEHLGAAAHLVAPGSADALAAGLADVIGDPLLRDDLAARGRALVADRFGVASMVDRYRDAYLDLTGAPVLTTTGDHP